jgi:anti-sigma B factor antagonist
MRVPASDLAHALRGDWPRLRSTREADDIGVVSLEGEFDLASSALLTEEAERVLEARKHLIVDLNDATFIDSSVINALIGLQSAAHGCGRVAVVQVGAEGSVNRVLKLTSIDRILPLTRNRPDAVRSIRTSPAAGEAIAGGGRRGERPSP